MENFYGRDYRKVGDICFSTDLVDCSRVLHSAGVRVWFKQGTVSLHACCRAKSLEWAQFFFVCGKHEQCMCKFCVSIVQGWVVQKLV